MIEHNRPSSWISAIVTLIVVFTAFLSGCVPPLPSKRDARGKTLSVCELSRDFAAYAGQMVSVRGIYYNGLRQRCPQRCPNGEPWPSVLDLMSSQYPRSDGTPSFTTEEPSWDAVDAAVLQWARAGDRGEIWVTVRGYLIVRAGSPLGPCDLEANGMFGGLQVRGWHGARLIVQRMSDLEFRRNPASQYDYTTYLGRTPLTRAK